MTSIEDFAGRITVLGYDAGDLNLTSVTLPDTDDDAGNGGGPENTFEYDNGRITAYTNASSGRTEFAYSDDGHVIRQTKSAGTANAATTTLVIPRLTTNQHFTVDGDSSTLQSYRTEDLLNAGAITQTGMWVDELGRVSTFEINGDGYVIKETDATGRVTIYERDDVGFATRIALYESEDGQLLDETLYDYDDGNLVQVQYADGSTETWTYDGLGRPTSYTNGLNQQTTNTYSDFITGGTESVTNRVIVGLSDLLSDEDDDLVTITTYTDVGLVASIEQTVQDNDGTNLRSIITSYSYDDNRLEQITFADGSDDESWIRITDYDIFDNPTVVEELVDVVGMTDVVRQTHYEYNNHDQVTLVIMDDPDGAGPLTRPATEYRYNATGRLSDVVETSVDILDPETREFGDAVRTHYTYRIYKIASVTQDADGTPITTEYDYDLALNLTSITDPLERTTEYTYDLLNRPIRITEPDPDGEGVLLAPATYLVYDAVGRLLAERDQRGYVTRYEYDQRHRVSKVLAPFGATTSFRYNAAGQVTDETDAEGRTTYYTYDDAGRLTAVRLPGQLATPIAFTYDTGSNLRFVTDQLGRTTEYQYDDQFRLAKEIMPHPTGSDTPGSETGRPVTTYTYFDDGQLETVTEKLTNSTSRTTSYEYDGAGRLETVVGPNSHAWNYSYDAFNNLTKVTDPNGNRTEYEYDNLHRVTKEIGEHPDNNAATGETGRPVTQYVYDDAGQLLEMIEKLTNSTTRTTSYVYDGLGRLKRSVAPDPSTGEGIYDGLTPGESGEDTPFTDYTYDSASNLLTQKDAAGLGMTYTYDALGRTMTERDANNELTRYTYDRVGNMTSLTDPNDNTTTWHYDALNRVDRETNELDDSRFYTYDLVGNLTKKIDRNERKVTYDYDRLDRLTTESWFANDADNTADREIDFTYDLAGRLLSSSDPDHEYNFAYGRLDLDSATFQSVELAGLSYPFDFYLGYDIAGRLTYQGIQVADPEEVNQLWDADKYFGYDNRNRLTDVFQRLNSHDETEITKLAEFTYDLTGQLSTIARTGDEGSLGANSVAFSEYTYDFAGRLTDLAHYQGDDNTGDLLAGYDYTWNQRNQLGAIDFTPNGVNSAFDYAGESVVYDYDNRGQIEGANYDSLTDESYGYDANGNRVDGDFDAGSNNRIITDGTYDYEYDDEGNIILRTKISDGSYTEYSWDHRNRLVKVTDYDDEEEEVSRVEYRYDANDKLIGRKVFLAGSGTASESGVFVYQNGQIVLQFDGTGNADLEYGDLSHRYLWGPTVDFLLADEQIDWGDTYADGEIFWALGDHLGTPRDWVDNDGEVVDHAIYDSYGNRQNVSTIGAAFDWTGRWRDPLTGLQYNDARWYNPSIQRWMSEDRIWDGVNRQAYVGNSPTMYTDHNGLEKARPGIDDLDPGKLHDQHLAIGTIEVIDEMRKEKWTPSNPRDPGAFGKEFDRRLSAKLNQNPNRGTNRYITDVCVDENGKVIKIGGGPGAKGTTQIDLLYHKGDLNVGDTIDQTRIIDVYDMKTGRINRPQLDKISKITGRPVKPIQPPYKWTSSGGWSVVESVQSKLDFLNKLGLGFMAFTVITSDVDACDVKDLMVERRKAGDDKLQIGVWAFSDLKRFLEKAGIDDRVSYWVALWVYDEQINAFSVGEH